MSFPLTRTRALEADLVLPQPGPNYIYLLPLEILVNVTFFLTLDKAVMMASICRSWRIATPAFITPRFANTDSISYGELEAFRLACTKGYLQHRPRVGNLLQKFVNLKTFILGNAKITLPQLSAVGKALYGVKTIDASGQKYLTEKKLRALLSSGDDLEVLSVANSPEMRSSWVEWIIRKCPSIIELNLSGTAITDYALGVLAVDCKQLKCVNITNCKDVTDIGIAHLTGQGIKIIN